MRFTLNGFGYSATYQMGKDGPETYIVQPDERVDFATLVIRLSTGTGPEEYFYKRQVLVLFDHKEGREIPENEQEAILAIIQRNIGIEKELKRLKSGLEAISRIADKTLGLHL